jgi:predicted ATPase
MVRKLVLGTGGRLLGIGGFGSVGISAGDGQADAAAALVPNAEELALLEPIADQVADAQHSDASDVGDP